MKPYFILTIFLTTLFSCADQTEPDISLDPKVKTYIDSFDIYIRMTDKDKASKILEKDYAKVVAFMDENHLNKNNYFILDGELALSNDLNYIMIPIRHYESLELEMKKGIDVKPLIKQQIVSKSGNLSGKDGFLILNIKTNSINKFQLWD